MKPASGRHAASPQPPGHAPAPLRLTAHGVLIVVALAVAILGVPALVVPLRSA